MRAVVHRPTPLRRRLVGAATPLVPSLAWSRLAGLALREIPEPPLPGPGWVRIRVRKAGVSMEDLRILDGRASPLLEPSGSWPSVPGREILGEVVEAGPAVERVAPGDRVVVDPWIPCAARGWRDDPCPPCAAGLASTCARAGEEGRLEMDGRPLARGARLGLHADLPGGWAEVVVAHRDQLLPVDAELPDRLAVLVEPVAAGLHAAREGWSADGARGAVALVQRPRPAPALVLGGGVRAVATVRGLRALGFDRPILVRAAERWAGAARATGASEVVHDDDALRDAMAATGARASMPLEGEEVWSGGGFDPVFEAEGTERSTARAVGLAAAGATVVLRVPSDLPGGMLERAAHRGVTLLGVAGYGPRPPGGPDASTLPVAHRLLVSEQARWAPLVTHVYPLPPFREALEAAAGRSREKARKVLLDPGL